MIELTTTTTGVDQALAGLQRVQAAAPQAQQAVIQPLGEQYLSALIDETPIGRGSGRGRTRLIASYAVQERYGATSEYRITNTAPWLGWVIRGRGPVGVVRAKALRFEIDGQVFFRKRVGAAAPNNFPARVRAKMQGKIGAAMAQLPGMIVRVFEGGA